MPDLTTVLALLGLVLGGGGLGTVIVQNIGKRVRTPADENEASKVAQSWYQGMLADAKDEREELRKTIEELREEKVATSKSVTRLEQLLARKDDRISELEHRRDLNVAKLQSGHTLTLADLLGTDMPTAFDVDLEHTT